MSENNFELENSRFYKQMLSK